MVSLVKNYMQYHIFLYLREKEYVIRKKGPRKGLTYVTPVCKQLFE